MALEGEEKVEQARGIQSSHWRSSSHWMSGQQHQTMTHVESVQ